MSARRSPVNWIDGFDREVDPDAAAARVERGAQAVHHTESTEDTDQDRRNS